MSAAVSSTSSNSADQRTSASWFAPTAVSFTESTKIRNDGVLGRRESSGTRTSKPARAATADRSRHQVPRFVTAEDDLPAANATRTQPSTGSIRSRRPSSASMCWRSVPPAAIACSSDDRRALRPGGKHHQMPRAAVVGRIELHDEHARDRR